MEGELDTFDFELALELGMTIEQLRGTLSNLEYLQWRAFFVWRNAQIELEAKSATIGKAR